MPVTSGGVGALKRHAIFRRLKRVGDQRIQESGCHSRTKHIARRVDHTIVAKGRSKLIIGAHLGQRDAEIDETRFFFFFF